MTKEEFISLTVPIEKKIMFFFWNLLPDIWYSYFNLYKEFYDRSLTNINHIIAISTTEAY